MRARRPSRSGCAVSIAQGILDVRRAAGSESKPKHARGACVDRPCRRGIGVERSAHGPDGARPPAGSARGARARGGGRRACRGAGRRGRPPARHPPRARGVLGADRAHLGRRRAEGPDEHAPGPGPRRGLRRQHLQRGRTRRRLCRVPRLRGVRAPPPLAHHRDPAGKLERRSLGFALKQFQRAWALDLGIQTIQWTADPLVRGNAFFNLVKLGAAVVAYHDDFYGPLRDPVERRGGERPGGRSVGPHLRPFGSRGSGRPGLEPSLGDGEVMVRAGSEGEPAVDSGGGNNGETLLAWIPEDIVRIREESPANARSLGSGPCATPSVVAWATAIAPRRSRGTAGSS